MKTNLVSPKEEMTPEEALREIAQHANANGYTGRGYSVLIGLVEKEKPKEPFYNKRKEGYECPNCHQESVDDIYNDIRYERCAKCGQVITWPDD